ncbi:MAG: Rieske 2Fe-2S domain-containing protein [Nitrososphaerales archaeon]
MPGESEEGPDEGRRDFLKYSAVASAALAVVGVAAITKSITVAAEAPATAASSVFPKVMVTTVSSLTVNTPVTFNYPLDTEPSILVKVGQKAQGGVGPDGDIVAFSNICQHLGCVYGFQAPGTSPPCNSSFVAKIPQGYCCCHGSQYDFLTGATVIGGPAPRPVPQVILEVDSSGNIYATGMNPPTIFGHGTAGSSDVSQDLSGGSLVGGSS